MQDFMNLKIYDAQDFPNYLPKLNGLYDELFSGGKGFRAKLVQLVGTHLEAPIKTQALLAQTIEFIHNASLLHDDLIDRSHLRRGKTAAWLKFTPEYAVLAGDYLLARVMVNLSSFGNIELVHYTSCMISDLLEGEWLQDSLVGDFNVTIQQLDRVHNLKTASLFKWCLRAPFMAVQKNDPEIHRHLEEMGTLLGQLFQRSDDLLDYDVRNHEGKAVLGDLKSKYLNSFGAFVTKDLKGSQIAELVKSQNLEEFKRAMGGDEKFEGKLKEFDLLNTQLIELYHHHCDSLEAKLASDSEKALVKKLRPLTDLLYWRKSPK
jgi:octaprenyl-diphosphate synthase